jgi:hypothetical protein
LKFEFKIRDRAKATYHGKDALFPRKIDEQAFKGQDRDRRVIAKSFPKHGHALLHAEEGSLGFTGGHSDNEI